MQVWGRVTYNGKPVQYGTLVFQPVRTSKSNWTAGPISEEGKYSLAPSQTDVALNPGRFEVYIRPPSPHDKYNRPGSDDVEESDQRAIAIAFLYPVPKRFFSPETSGMWVDIGDEPTRVDIDLKD